MLLALRGTKHGLSRTPEYRAWMAIQQRCYKGKTPHYHRYGGRGIKVCRRWRRSFLAFLIDMGFRPSPQHSIDRRNNNGHYEPSNCRWATRKEQARNRGTAKYVLFGEYLTLADLAELAGMPRETIQQRLRRGWSIERAVFQARKVPEPDEDRPQRSLHQEHAWQHTLARVSRGHTMASRASKRRLPDENPSGRRKFLRF